MSGYCPADCSDNTLVANDPGSCDLSIRKRSVDRIGFLLCTTDLPSPFNCANITALVNAGELVFSSQLVNVNWQDPTFEELQIADCRPAEQIITGRIMEFQDRIAIVKSNSSPWTSGTQNFYDYDFWADKKSKNMRLRYLLTFCDGSVIVARDENGDPMSANLNVFLAHERQGTGGNSYILEFKKGSLAFKGDPLDFTNKPEEDGAGNIFNINDCNLF